MITLSLHLGLSATTRWWSWLAWPPGSVSRKQPPPPVCLLFLHFFFFIFPSQLCCCCCFLEKLVKNKIVIIEHSTLVIKTFKVVNLLGRRKHCATFRTLINKQGGHKFSWLEDFHNFPDQSS